MSIIEKFREAIGPKGTRAITVQFHEGHAGNAAIAWARDMLQTGWLVTFEELPHARKYRVMLTGRVIGTAKGAFEGYVIPGVLDIEP